MKIKNKYIIATFTLFFSLNASAHLLQYNLGLETLEVEGPAFGGVSVGDVFKGTLAIEAHVLQDIANEDGGFATVIVPLQDENDNFNLSYTLNVGNYSYTEQTAGSFTSEFTVDDPTNVEGVVNFSLDIGDLSFNDFEIAATGEIPMIGAWSATDGGSGNVVSGVLTISTLPSEVPIPAALWLFGSSLLGLSGLKRKKSESNNRQSFNS